jgi:hypothetical protein
MDMKLLLKWEKELVKNKRDIQIDNFQKYAKKESISVSSKSI